jgi:hypothetical protein
MEQKGDLSPTHLAGQRRVWRQRRMWERHVVVVAERLRFLKERIKDNSMNGEVRNDGAVIEREQKF